MRRAENPIARPLLVVLGLAARAQEHYERAIKAQRDGNWALYGEEIERARGDHREDAVSSSELSSRRWRRKR